MVQGKWFQSGGDIAEPVKIRLAVFGRGRDALDDWAQQVMVYRDSRPVGSARLWWADGAFMMGDVGVLEGERGKGYGDLLVRLLLFKALNHNAVTIALDAPEAVVGFFAKYGFRSQAEAGAVRRMVIRADKVQLSHCGGNCEGCRSRSDQCVPKALR